MASVSLSASINTFALIRLVPPRPDDSQHGHTPLHITTIMTG